MLVGLLLGQGALQADDSAPVSRLDRSVVSGPLAPRDYWLFEAGPVRPLAMSHDGKRLYAANIPDGRLEVFAITGLGLTYLGSVPVGMEPVAVAVSPDDKQVWVVNHLSDSISVVNVEVTTPFVEHTLWVGDEPRDIIFAGPEKSRVFITTAHRGQNSPINPALTSGGIGRADVWVFDSENIGEGVAGKPLTILTLFGDSPRALASSADGRVVYAAIFRSGNKTTTMWPAALTGFPKPPPNDSADGVIEPTTGVILKWRNGAWRDEINRNYNSVVSLALPDMDVFRIDAMAEVPVRTSTIRSVGTTLFNMAVNPVSGSLYVSNIDAFNHIRFAGDSNRASSSVRGHLADHRISTINEEGVKHQRLNKHLDFSKPFGDEQDRTNSLSLPMDMVVSSDGVSLYVAAYGSAKVAVYKTSDLESGTLPSGSENHIEVNGGGPAGLALDETHERLYVLTRFDNSISVIDLNTGQEKDRLSMFSPEPESVTAGRKFLYDARLTSGFGNDSCATCHLFGDNDALAWDLGDPAGIVKAIPNKYEPLTANHRKLNHTFHPLKGPMTTQSMRGLPRHGPQHWRGDRTGTQRIHPETLEEAAFKEFNEAFAALAAKQEPLSESDMLAFSDFSMQLSYPPNPIRKLDNSLTEAQQLGRSLYMKGVQRSDGVLEVCVTCHTLSPAGGIFGTTGLMAFNDQPGEKDFKIPHFRDQYQKVGMFTSSSSSPRNEIRGFALNHNGATSINATFAEFGIPTSQTNSIKDYLFAYPAEHAPVMGQQLSLAKDSSEAAFERYQLLLQRARVVNPVPECDLTIKTMLNEYSRGWIYDRQTATFMSDVSTGEPLNEASMENLIRQASTPLTISCAPWGSGRRIGIDRDGDLIADYEEILQGSNPGSKNSSGFRAQAGLWYNPERDGSGFDIQHGGNSMVMTWYTYDSDEKPTWYQAVATASQNWSAELRRVHWDPQAGKAVINVVGSVSLSFSDSRNARIGWQIDDHQGTENIQKMVFSVQPTDFLFTGMWYDPQESGYGITVDTQGDRRTAVVYFYDADNQPSWVISSQNNDLSTSSKAIATTGPCPWCEYRPASVFDGGNLSLNFTHRLNASTNIDVYLQNPGVDQWKRQNVELSRLTAEPNHVPFH